MTLLHMAQAASAIRWTDLGLDPVALQIGPFALRWYSLAYLAGIILGWAYLRKLVAQPGAPMAERHADDLIFYATLGIILGGRLGYVFFYEPDMLLRPLSVFELWRGGMSFHGGAIGTVLAIAIMTHRQKLRFWRVCDYIACVAPLGLLFGRLANFVNGELWGRPTDVPWAMIFPGAGDVPRHPSQLYEAALEGVVLFAILNWLFWRSDARYKPGFLTGMFALCYGLIRFGLEFVRNPDQQLVWLVAQTGLSMGQWLSIPLALAGLWLILTSPGRRVRVEPTAGTSSIA